MKIEEAEVINEKPKKWWQKIFNVNKSDCGCKDIQLIEAQERILLMRSHRSYVNLKKGLLFFLLLAFIVYFLKNLYSNE